MISLQKSCISNRFKIQFIVVISVCYNERVTFLIIKTTADCYGNVRVSLRVWKVLGKAISAEVFIILLHIQVNAEIISKFQVAIVCYSYRSFYLNSLKPNPMLMRVPNYFLKLCHLVNQKILRLLSTVLHKT
jgi:hypothetical protein